MRRKTCRERRVAIGGAAAALVAAAVTVALVLTTSGGGGNGGGNGSAHHERRLRTEGHRATTTAPAGTSTAPRRPVGAIGPGASAPEAAARRFAEGYLRLAAPIVQPCPVVEQSLPAFCDLTIAARSPGPAMRVHLQQGVARTGYVNTTTWWVTGAQAQHIEVRTPSPLAAPKVGRTFTVDGQSTSTEGTIAVEVRAADWTPAHPSVVAQTTLQGGANGTIGPLRGTITLPATTPPGPAVLVLYAPDASGQNQLLEATVIPVTITG